MAQEMLNQYQVELSVSSKIEESLQTLEQEVGCIKRNLEGKRKKVTLSQVNEKLEEIFNLASLMNAKLDQLILQQHNALRHQISTQSQAVDI